MDSRLRMLALLSYIVFASAASAAGVPDTDAVARELAGVEASRPAASAALAVPDPEAHRLARTMLGSTGLLLVPDSTNRRVMAFDPTSGDLVDADFVPADAVNLTTPIHAVLDTCRVPTILLSDQVEDAIFAYDLDGAPLGLFAPVGGVNTAVMDNVRGIWNQQGYVLLATVASGANANAIPAFDPQSGAYFGNFVANGAGGLASPFAIQVRFDALDVLVAGIDSDAVHAYTHGGAPLANLTSIDTFPEQIAVAANGNVLIANFSGGQTGIVEVTSTGAPVGVWTAPGLSGYRGVYELPGGTLLTTTGAGVHEIDRSGNLIETKIGGVSARFIELVRVDPELLFADGFEAGLVTFCWISFV